jgi:FeS assembly SUF system protein
MSDDIEHLKKNKIETPHGPRYGLPTMQEEGPDESETEAYGGSGVEPTQPVDEQTLHERITEQLKTVYDPEIPVNIHDLGLIYGIDIGEKGHVNVRMTLTAPACPVAGSLVREVAQKVGDVEGVSTSHVELVWEPPWTPEQMSELAKLELGMF